MLISYNCGVHFNGNLLGGQFWAMGSMNFLRGQINLLGGQIFAHPVNLLFISLAKTRENKDVRTFTISNIWA